MVTQAAVDIAVAQLVARSATRAQGFQHADKGIDVGPGMFAAGIVSLCFR